MNWILKLLKEIKMMGMLQDIRGRNRKKTKKLCMSRWNNEYLLQQMLNHTLIRTISWCHKKHME